MRLILVLLAGVFMSLSLSAGSCSKTKSNESSTAEEAEEMPAEGQADTWSQDTEEGTGTEATEEETMPGDDGEGANEDTSTDDE